MRMGDIKKATSVPKCRCAWISPDGRIFFADEYANFTDILDVIGITDKLGMAITSEDLSNKEDIKTVHKDKIYTALRLGFVLITTFYNHFSVDYCCSNFTPEQCSSIKRVFFDLSRQLKESKKPKYRCISFENFGYMDTKTFKNPKEFFEYIEKEYIG